MYHGAAPLASARTRPPDRGSWPSAKASPFTDFREDVAPGDVGGGRIRRVRYGSRVLVLETKKCALHACDPNDCRKSLRLLVQEAALDRARVLDGHDIVVDDRLVYYVAADTLPDGGATFRATRIAR